MREIQFRAWDNKEEKMIVTNVVDSGVPTMNWLGHCYKNGVLQDYTMMQYVGIKDKNGKQIFEGDIIRLREICTNPKHNDNGVHDEIFEVVYFGVGFAWLSPEDVIVSGFSAEKYSANSDALSDKNVEVIGNIYENPELIGAINIGNE